MNQVVTVPKTPHAVALVDRLNVYEKTWIDSEAVNPDASEVILDHWARARSGLTCEGLCTARVYAGKYATMRPGIIAADPGAKKYEPSEETDS